MPPRPSTALGRERPTAPAKRFRVPDATITAVPVLVSAEEQGTHAFKPAPERARRTMLSWRETTVRSNLRNGGRRELNATKHGILSRHAVLPWESRAEFDALLASLVSDHMPEGVTERHLVEELAIIMWRKQRVLLAEAASHRAGLQRGLEWDRQGLVRRALPHLRVGTSQVDDPKAAVAASPGGSEAELEQLIADRAGTKEAVEILKAGKPKAYEKALAALTDDIRDWWDEALLEGSIGRALAEGARDEPDGGEEDESCRPDGGSLLRYLEDVVSDWLQTRRQEVERRCEVRAQALGEALDAERLDKLARYETHLDRKLGRTLAMLLKLQEMRRTITAPAA
jgi:hypothetical protein